MHKSRLAILNKKFGKLLVLETAGSDNHKNGLYKCKCDCGKIVILTRGQITKSKTKSCGCVWKQLNKEKGTTHGMHGTSIYSIWLGIKYRCYNKKHKRYKDYGGRGITVCVEWLESFENFYKDVGDRPKGMSLDRKDNNKGYSKENCKWSTTKEQNNNKRDRKDSNFITYKGKTKTITQWAKRSGLTATTVSDRLKRAWSFEKAITPIEKEI